MVGIAKKYLRTLRRIRVVQLWALGVSGEDTVAKMKEEGFRISHKTVYRDRHSTEAAEYVEELIRLQLQDIKGASLEQKLNYRDKLIGKLVPQRIEALSMAKIEQTVKVENVDVDVTESEDEILSKAARILTRKDRARSLH